MAQNDDICVLFFNKNDDNIFIKKMSETVTVRCVFKDVNKILRAIRRVHIKSGLPGIQIWFTNWRKELENYTVIVCIATEYSIPVLRWIHKKMKGNIKLVNYYWDEIHNSGYPIKNDVSFENWSFNKENCEEFHMKYNPQFWIEAIDLKSDETEYDISFVGADRDGIYRKRSEMVHFLYETIKTMEYKSLFWYVTKEKTVYPEICREEGMSLPDFLETIKKSRVIVELTETDHPWLTQRVFLAISNGKKLITNNKNIKKEAFYSSSNIFILGEDDMNLIGEFIKSPYEYIDDAILKSYELSSWINRFRHYQNGGDFK